MRFQHGVGNLMGAGTDSSLPKFLLGVSMMKINSKVSRKIDDGLSGFPL